MFTRHINGDFTGLPFPKVFMLSVLCLERWTCSFQLMPGAGQKYGAAHMCCPGYTWKAVRESLPDTPGPDPFFQEPWLLVFIDSGDELCFRSLPSRRWTQESSLPRARLTFGTTMRLPFSFSDLFHFPKCCKVLWLLPLGGQTEQKTGRGPQLSLGHPVWMLHTVCQAPCPPYHLISLEEQLGRVLRSWAGSSCQALSQMLGCPGLVLLDPQVEVDGQHWGFIKTLETVFSSRLMFQKKDS